MKKLLLMVWAHILWKLGKWLDRPALQASAIRALPRRPCGVSFGSVRFAAAKANFNMGRCWESSFKRGMLERVGPSIEELQFRALKNSLKRPIAVRTNSEPVRLEEYGPTLGFVKRLPSVKDLD